MGGKMAGCGVLQPMTTRQMKSGAFVKLKKRLLKDGKCRKTEIATTMRRRGTEREADTERINKTGNLGNGMYC